MKNILIVILVAAVIVLGYLQFKAKKTDDVSTETSTQQTNTNSNTKKIYDSSELSFSYDSSVSASPTTNPKGGTILSKGANDSNEEVIFYAPIMTSSFDPAYANSNVKVEALKVDPNEFDVYTTNSAKIYILTTRTGGVVSITTPLNGAHYIDLSSIKAK